MIDHECDWLKRWTRYAPRANAFKDADSSTAYTYAALHRLSSQLARHLADEFKVTQGDRVAVLATNEMEFLPLFFAVQRLGAILVPLNFRLAKRELTQILEDSAPKLLITQNRFQSTVGFDRIENHWAFDGEGGLTDFIARDLLIFHGEPDASVVHDFCGNVDSTCMLLYTSGTTGLPKGAMITNKMLFWNSINTQLRLDLSRNDISIAFAPFFHTGGWNVLFTPFIHRGASTIFLRKFDPARVLQICEQERASMFFGVPTMLEMLAREPEFQTADLTSLRFVVVGGEPMPIELIKIWDKKGVPIRQGFGLTEFGPNVFSLGAEDSVRKIGSIGLPNFYVDARVVDDQNQDVANDTVGELILRGPICTPGYWNNPKGTADAIRDGWFYTGDLVRRDHEGYYFVAGRKKDMFISGGENVYPVEVERFLSTHPAIREVAVTGVPDAKWGEVGKAWIVLKSDAHISAEDVEHFCQTGLARFKIPKHVTFLNDLPKSDSGKILKRLLVDSQNETVANFATTLVLKPHVKPVDTRSTV